MNHSSLSISNSETSDFKRLAGRVIILCSPFLLAAVFICAVDPFNYFAFSRIIPESVKAPIASQFNPCFWALNKFEREPQPYVLLGDSRMVLQPAEIKQVSGEDYVNLGFGGGSIRETADAFALINKKIEIKKVYISINLDKYNDYVTNNRTIFYTSTHDNPALYFLNQAVWQSAYYDVKSRLSGEKFTLGVPDMKKEEFWQDELALEKTYYTKYAEPEKYRQVLKEIVDYCRQHDIKIAFIIFPTHIDAQHLIIETNMTEKRAEMLKDLTAIADVYDFDWENEETRNIDNFNDPIHINADLRKKVTAEIWGNFHQLGRFYQFGESQN